MKPVEREHLSRVLNKYLHDKQTGVILVVEDDEEIRLVTRRALQREGYSVVEASNGRVALDCLEQTRPDLILLDLMMPELDGFQFLDHVHATPAWRAIPVIVLSAMELTHEDRERLYGSVQYILQKGCCSREDILHEVRDFVLSRTRSLPLDEENHYV